MENLMDYKIIMDYAAQEVKKLEGSKIGEPERYERAVLRLRRAKNEFIRAMNQFAYDHFSIGIKFQEEEED